MYNRYCKLRDAKGYKDADISRLTGISKPTLSDWKRGVSKPKPDKLIKLAECLGVTTDYLLTGEEKEKADYSVANAKLADLLLTDSKLSEALQVYAKLNQTQKEAIVNMINSYKVEG